MTATKTTIPEVDFAQPVGAGELTTIEQPQVPGANAAPEPVTILNIIERASRDPNVDIDKMERLFRMKLDMEARAAKASYLSALADMQPQLPVITKHGVIGMNKKDDDGRKTGEQVAMTKYARWEDVVEGITPVLAAHGFSLSFRIAQPTLDRIVVSGVLGHRDGHTEETAISLPIDSSGAKNNVQGWGSSASYGKRYTAFALLNISARGEDDDGAGGDDHDGLANGPRDPETGRPLSTYDVTKNESAKKIADRIVESLNLSPNKEAAKELWAAENKVQPGKKKSPLAWLKDNAPGQMLRCQTAYENVVGLE